MSTRGGLGNSRSWERDQVREGARARVRETERLMYSPRRVETDDRVTPTRSLAAAIGARMVHLIFRPLQ